MRLLPALLCACLVPASAAAAEARRPLLVSGFDDVLRQADNTSLPRAALMLLRRDRTFAGMPERFAALARGDEGRFVVVSALSSSFTGRARRLLDSVGLAEAELRLRSWMREPSIENFKIAAVRRVLEGDPGRRFIAVFDDSPPSRELARRLPREFPGRLSAVYLHEVGASGPAEGAVLYVTAYDIAASEARAGRLASADTARVADAVLAAEPRDLIPAYAHCPRDHDPCGPGEAGLCERVRDKVRSLCRGR